MAIKADCIRTGTFIVSYSKRHPLTRVPVSLRRTGIKSKAEAKREEAKLIIEVEDRIRRTQIPTWTELVTRFLQGCSERGLTIKTVENYRLCLHAHTLDAWGTRLVDTIGAQEIRNLVLERTGHKSPSHQKSLLKFIRGAFTFAKDSGYIIANPTPDMKFRLGDKIKQVLTENQVRTLLEQAKSLTCEWYPLWTMAVYTGMRSGELYALSWDKVNLDNRQILVDCSWNNVDGFKSTKSGDDRIIEIAPPLLPMLRELKIAGSDSTFVLPRIDKWEKGEQARELRMFLMGLGLSPVRFHDLRATWATIMLSKGVEPIKVMKMGGWKDIKTMMIYARKAGIDIQGITDCLDLHNPSTERAKVIGLHGKYPNFA